MSYLCIMGESPDLGYYQQNIRLKMRGSFWNYALIILLVLMIFGVISLGDVVGFIFYVFMGIIILALILLLVFRYRINRVRREMYQQQGGDPRGENYRSARRGTHERAQEGEVIIKQTTSKSSKVVNNDVGSYVEYEEIDEEISGTDA